MPNCRKVSAGSRAPGLYVPGRDALPMSVIVEEPPNMRESRLDDRHKHPDDIKPSSGSFLDALKERPHDAPQPHSVEPSTCKSPVSRSAFEPLVASAAAKPLPKAQRSPRAEDATLTVASLETRSSRREAVRRTSAREVSNDRSLNHRAPQKPTNASRHQSTASMSSHREKPPVEQHESRSGRPCRRRLEDESRSTRPKAFSDPPVTTSTPRRGDQLHSPKASHGSGKPTARVRSKSSTKMEPDPSPSAYESDRRAAPDLLTADRPCSTSRDRRRSKSPPLSDDKGQVKRMLPPFRRPSRVLDDDSPSSKTRAGHTAGSSDHSEQQIGTRQPSHRVDASSGDRAKSPPARALHSDTESNEEDWGTKSSRELSFPARERSRLYSKLVSRRHNDTEERQVASCRQSRMPTTLHSESPFGFKPGKDKVQVSPRQYGSSRERSHVSPSFPSSRSPNAVSSDKSSDKTAPRSTPTSSLSRSPRPRRMSAPTSPLRLRHYEGRFMNRRRQTLFYFSLFPPEGMPLRGVVLCLHRLGDHCRRNANVYERLCREGFGVITYDLINHGVSDLDEHKTRTHIGDFNHLVEDTNDFVTFAKRSIYTDALRYWRKCQSRHQDGDPDNAVQPELPLIIAGTSFGSIIGINTILSGEHKFHAAVWSSPTFGVIWNPLLWAEAKLAKPLAAMMPKAKVVPPVQHDLLSRDPNFLRRFKADPLTNMGMMTARTGHEVLQAMVRLQEDARVMDPSSAFCAVPTLFLGGSLDGISDQQAAIKFFGTMGNFDKEFKLFDGLYHLVYEEPEKENVFRYLAKWLHRRFPSETR